MKKKGFTLIELLAVIVILAIIALIATPMVLNTIEEARKGSAKASAYTYISEVEKYIVSSQLDSSKVKLETGKTYSVNNAGENGIVLNDIIDIKGDKPTSGTITIGEDNTVEKANLTINNYELKCANKTCEVIGTKDETDDDILLTETAIEDIAKVLVYVEDGETCKTDGSTYTYMDGCYIKGTSETNIAAASNYVWYNGFMWRIMGINSDGTVRLITDETVTAIPYGATNTATTYETDGYIHTWLNDYFYNQLRSNGYSLTKDTILQEGSYFCSQSTNNAQLEVGRENCDEGYKVDTRIGIISIDEYLLSMSDTTPYSYLNIWQVQRTMTPINESKLTYIDSIGEVNWNLGDVTYSYGVRPVININPDAIVTSGNGTTQNFYVLEEDKSTNITGKLSEKSTSGEYVLLQEHTYRVVSKDNNSGVKLILDDFYEEKDEEGNSISNFSFGDDNTFTSDSGIGQKLNEDVLDWLNLSGSTKIVETNWDQGPGFENSMSYKNAFDGTSDVSAKVGLIAIGEMLSSQSSTIVTKNYTYSGTQNSGGAAQDYWMITKAEGSSRTWRGFKQGNADSTPSNYAIRPVIMISNNVTISGGNGTWKTPYRI